MSPMNTNTLKKIVAELSGKGVDAANYAKGLGRQVAQGYGGQGTLLPSPAHSLGQQAAKATATIQKHPVIAAGGGALAAGGMAGAMMGGAAGEATGNAEGQQQQMQMQAQQDAELQQQQLQAALQEMGQKAIIDPATGVGRVKKGDIDAALAKVMGQGQVPPLSPQQYQEIAAMGNMEFTLG